MDIETDFTEVRQKINYWKKQFPMFIHDIRDIEKSIEGHIKVYSNHMVNYRQSRKKNYLELASKELKSIENIVAMAEKMQLMSILSR